MVDHSRNIFITGAASGIGRATALLFAEKGWFVGLYDLDSKGLEYLGSQIGADNCCYKAVDVSNRQNVREGIAHFSSKTGGRMKILFNNAGVLKMGSLESIDNESGFDEIDVNFKGVLNCILASLELLKNTGNSRVINMSSASALYGTAYLAVYSATKAAISSLTESLNLELKPYGIFVSDIRAPFVNTPLLKQETKAPSIEKLGIHIEPEEVARVVFTASRNRIIHNDTRGVKPLQLLLRLPGVIRTPLLTYLLTDRKKS